MTIIEVIMSKLTDYSKFDHLSEDSDGENDEENIARVAASTSASDLEGPTVAKTRPFTSNDDVSTSVRRDKTSGRYRFEYNGNTIYEFEQGLDDVTIYIVPPPYVTKGRQVKCTISANHLKLGLVDHGNAQKQSWFLNEDTYGTVDVDESTWTLEDYDDEDRDKNKNNNDGSRRKVIVITLIKANRGTAWEAALKGSGGILASNTATSNSPSKTIDAFSMEQVKKDLLLERFKEENPGFDFSGADFNGSVPDARSFMGGVQYK